MSRSTWHPAGDPAPHSGWIRRWMPATRRLGATPSARRTAAARRGAALVGPVGPLDPGHGAQGPRRDDGVDAGVGHRQVGAVQTDARISILDVVTRAFARPREVGGLHGEDPSHRVAVVGQVAPGAEADLEDLTGGADAYTVVRHVPDVASARATSTRRGKSLLVPPSAHAHHQAIVSWEVSGWGR